MSGMAKFQRGSHYCKTPISPLKKREGKAWVCGQCGSVFKCKLVKGRLVWLMTFDRRSK